MKLSLRHSSGKTITLHCSEHNPSIRDLMTMLYLKADTQPVEASQMPLALYLQEKKLEIDRHIADYAIDESSLITIIFEATTPFLDNALLWDEEKEPIIPEEFFCPLTLQIFLNPVLLPCGKTVEKEFIQKWIADKGNSPFTRQPLTQENLRDDEATKLLISNFFEKHSNSRFINQIKEKKYENQGYVIRQFENLFARFDSMDFETTHVRILQRTRVDSSVNLLPDPLLLQGSTWISTRALAIIQTEPNVVELRRVSSINQPQTEVREVQQPTQFFASPAHVGRESNSLPFENSSDYSNPI